jgi:hypothetical protein
MLTFLTVVLGSLSAVVLWQAVLIRRTATECHTCRVQLHRLIEALLVNGLELHHAFPELVERQASGGSPLGDAAQTEPRYF